MGDATEGWLAVVETVPDIVPAGQLFELRYEDLVTDTAATLAPLLNFLGLPWDDRVLRHAEVPHPLFDHPYGHPSAAAARNLVTTAAIGHRRTDLSAGRRVEFERRAGASLERLGYPLE